MRSLVAMTTLFGRRALLRGAAGLAAMGLFARRAAVPGPAHAASVRIPIVAAENFYADVIGQIAGDHVILTSIISDPNADPHEYETSARDIAAIARARLVIVNGIGYDGFMTKLLRASPNPAREVIVVAALVGRKDGDNKHLWYGPPTMLRFARTVTEALARIDAANARSYHDWLLLFETSYKPFTDKVAALRGKIAGTPIAVTEPVFNYMADALGLKVLTPEEFQRAIEEGEDPPARALAQMEDQLHAHRVKVLMYNTQTVTPLTEKVKRDAKQFGVPIVGVSETLPPGGLNYQRWMLSQLDALEQALGARP
ncbi:MAG TPA: zinc ABC transporter substrate-binding protein [bacterium]|nr:zinc ABC transporter substrate-binding protein [bacterium]